MRRDVFQAIADPTRREIIRLLAHQSMNLNTLADHFEISRPAISKQVKILAECGVIEVVQEGRERFCHLKADELKTVSDWVEECRQFWMDKFDSLEEYLKKLQQKDE